MAHDKQKCAEAGMNDHVAKPMEPNELCRALLKWIKPKQNVSSAITVISNEVAFKQNDDLPVIDGLDVELGLKYMAGMKPLYFSVLSKYVTNQVNTSTQLRAALKTNDYITAERIVHTVKGLSGNIGASNLQEMAAEIEALIKNGVARDVIENKIVPFEKAQMLVITSIQAALLPDSATVITLVDSDRSKGAIVLTRLNELLRNHDCEASDLLDEHLDLLRSLLDMQTFTNVESAIRQYDFEKALQSLNTMPLS
jgi:two-component system sensor histidine kinase/response regulator